MALLLASGQKFEQDVRHVVNYGVMLDRGYAFSDESMNRFRCARPSHCCLDGDLEANVTRQMDAIVRFLEGENIRHVLGVANMELQVSPLATETPAVPLPHSQGLLLPLPASSHVGAGVCVAVLG